MLKRTLVLNQGETYSYSFDISDSNGDPIDANTWTGYAQIRKHYESETSYDFTVSIANSVLNMSMTALETSMIPSGPYVYDAEIRSTGDVVIKVMSGIITVFGEVTR